MLLVNSGYSFHWIGLCKSWWVFWSLLEINDVWVQTCHLVNEIMWSYLSLLLPGDSWMTWKSGLVAFSKMFRRSETSCAVCCCANNQAKLNVCWGNRVSNINEKWNAFIQRRFIRWQFIQWRFPWPTFFKKKSPKKLTLSCIFSILSAFKYTRVCSTPLIKYAHLYYCENNSFH